MNKKLEAYKKLWRETEQDTIPWPQGIYNRVKDIYTINV